MKIFCIGFHKTGTTSVSVALQSLGYKVTGPNGVHDENISDNVYSMVDTLVAQYDAFQDNPWPIVYKYCDKKYPNSKFILTTRSSGSWVNSQVRHFGRDVTPMRKWIYGVGNPEGNEGVYVKKFEEHNMEVIDYFKNRPNDLLILDLRKMDCWDEICSFLNVDIPEIPFPHTNKSKDREKKIGFNTKIISSVKQLMNFMTK